MTLTNETKKDLNRWFWPRLVLPFLMVFVALLGIYQKQVESNARDRNLAEQQLEISRQIEKDTIRGELSDIDHRIKHERCDIAVQNQVVQNRINDRTEAQIDVCDPDEAIPDLMARRDLLDARLRAMGAYEERGG